MAQEHRLSKTSPTRTGISVIVPAYNSSSYLTKCLASLQQSSFSNFEVIVSDDGSTDDTASVAKQFGAEVALSSRTRGPASARNRGAKQATYDILFFVDSDVCVQPDTLERIHQAFAGDAQLDAIIGSYDDDPGASDFVSRYRNLMHCYVHQKAARKAQTFWSGCGAIRRTVFEEIGGFDEAYAQPSIEDIELGSRLTAAGKNIVLDPDLQVKHLKHWSMAQVVKTDILQRGIPWTELILRNRAMPNDLNLKLGQRLSVMLIFAASLAAVWALYSDWRTFLLSVSMMMFLAFVQAYFWSERKFQAGRMATATLATLGILAASWNHKSDWIVWAVGASWAVAFARHFIPDGPVRRATGAVFGGAVTVLALATGISVCGYAVALGFYLPLALIVAINKDFYLFLARRTGKLGSLAAIPFHLLFFFYSGLSFVLGALKFLFWPQGEPASAPLASTWESAPAQSRVATNRPVS